MAFRSSALATSNTGGGTLTATPAGVAANDYLGGYFVMDASSGDVTPTGWTNRVTVNNEGPDTQGYQYCDKIAAGGDSFTTQTLDGRSCSWFTAAWSGRDTAAPRNDLQNAAKNTSTASPITISTAGATSGTVGVTASAGDDIAFFSNLDQQGQTDVWGYDNDLTGYTERQDSNHDWMTACLYTKDNVSGGGEGGLSITSTRSSGASGAGWSTVIIAIKAAAGAAAALNLPAVFASRAGRVLSPGRTL